MSTSGESSDSVICIYIVSGVEIYTSTELGYYMKYQRRVVSNANNVNLKFEEVKLVFAA